MIQIEFWNKCDFESRLYQTGWKQRMFLDADLTMPEYEIVREGKEDINKDFQSDSNQWQKSVKLVTLCNETNLESLYFMSVHSNIELAYNGIVYEVISCNINAEFESECYARTEITFYVESLFSGCCSNFELDPVFTAVDDIIKIQVAGSGASNRIDLSLLSGVNSDMYVTWGDGTSSSALNTGINIFTKIYPAGITGIYEINAWICSPGTSTYLTGELTVCVINSIIGTNTLLLKNFNMPTNVPKLVNYEANTDSLIEVTAIELNDSMVLLDTLNFIPSASGLSNVTRVNSFENTNLKTCRIRYAKLTDINGLLVFIESNGHSNGTIDFSGGTSAGLASLNPEGAAARTALLGRGYTVTLNP